jgi:signal transduction histidine kinase
MKDHRKQGRWKLPLIAIGLLILIASMAAIVLWNMYDLHNRLAHRDAAMSVIKSGRLITSGLARYITETPEQDPLKNWPVFSRTAHALAASEDQLQYISVTRNEVTVFHEQMRPLQLPPKTAWEEQIAPAMVTPVRQLLQTGTGTVPVVVFSLPFDDHNGNEYQIHVGLRKDAIDREEQAVSKSIRSTFRLTLITIIISFSTVILVIIWMFFREEEQDRRRRSEEHLAYAGVMASGIVHDFRNPMSSLRLDVQMLQRQTAKGSACDLQRVSQLSQRILNITERMEKVFQEFLFLSHPGRSDPEPLQLKQILQECVAIAQPRLDAAGVKLHMEMPANEIIVTAHAEALRRALLNVIINAEQHAGENGQVLLRLLQHRKRTVILIANTGKSIPGKFRKKVFDLFYTTRPGGTGLGLFLARAALQRNGGTIELDQATGYATCFRIELPIHH